jgi:hypothetical protein
MYVDAYVNQVIEWRKEDDTDRSSRVRRGYTRGSDPVRKSIDLFPRLVS